MNKQIATQSTAPATSSSVSGFVLLFNKTVGNTSARVGDRVYNPGSDAIRLPELAVPASIL